MAREGIDIVVNGGVWNSVKPSGVISGIAELAMDKLKYMSNDAMKEWLLQACEMAEETMEWKKNATLSRKITYLRNYFKDNDTDRERTMSVLINVVLSGQGLGTLAGFGFGKSGSAYQTNPELIAMRDIKDF